MLIPDVFGALREELWVKLTPTEREEVQLWTTLRWLQLHVSRHGRRRTDLQKNAANLACLGEDERREISRAGGLANTRRHRFSPAEARAASLKSHVDRRVGDGRSGESDQPRRGTGDGTGNTPGT